MSKRLRDWFRALHSPLGTRVTVKIDRPYGSEYIDDLRKLRRDMIDHEEALEMNLEFDRKKLAVADGITTPLHEGVL